VLEKRIEPGGRRGLAASLAREGRLSVLAEIKRASPSAGMIREGADATELARAMEAAGAQALSVLTDARYFSGSLEDLRTARGAIGIPVLEKDFIIDAYQVHEAAAWSADAVLLIVRILSDEEFSHLYDLAVELGLDCLVEVHSRGDLERALLLAPSLVGINNRDLSTFTVDINTTLKLMPSVPANVKVVSQSGISRPEEAKRLFEAGVSAIQVGESIMRAGDPGAKIRELLSSVE
jgi:indole-3-glycerol phosphate synthase